MTNPLPSTESCLSEYRLDLYENHLLSPGEQQEAMRHLHGCARCQARQREHAQARFDFSPDPELTRRLAGSTRGLRSRRRWQWPVLAFTGAAAAAVLVVAATVESPLGEPMEATAKGATVRLVVDDEDGQRDVVDTTNVHPGARIQAYVTAATPVEVAMLSIDGAGSMTAYVANQGHTVSMAAGTLLPLPNSTVLDAVLGAETVAVFVCPSSQPLVFLEPNILRDATPQPCQVTRFQLHKVARP